MLARLGDLGGDCSETVLVCGRVWDNQAHSSAVRSAQMIADVTVDRDDLSTFDGVHYAAESVYAGAGFLRFWQESVDHGD